MTTHYVLWTELKTRLGIDPDLDSTNDEQRLLDVTEQAGAWLEQQCNRRFDRYVDVRLFKNKWLNNGGDLLTSIELLLDADLIELLTDPGYTLEPLNADRAFSTVTADDGWTLNDDDLIEIDGVWGWGGEFKQVELLTAALDATETSILVVATAAEKYETFMTLRIDDELLLVTAILDTTHITVERGHNGSTGAIHAIGAANRKFVADTMVRLEVTDYVRWHESKSSSPVSGSWSPFGNESVPTAKGIGPPDVLFNALHQGLKRSARPLAL